MTDDPFDHDRIRLNWARALADGPTAAAPPSRPPSPAPPDDLTLAHADLADLESLVATQFASHRPLLDPFVQRVRDALAQLEDALPTGAPLPPLRASLDRALVDLEDLLEVILLMPLP